MGILTKATRVVPGLFSHRRIYFAHVPKTAGISVCVAFLRAGWDLRNVRVQHGRGLGKSVAQEFGITCFHISGPQTRLRELSRSPQHAPHEVWSQWGPFDESFAVVRRPYERYLSAVKFQFENRDTGHAKIDDFRRDLLERFAADDWKRRTEFDGHFAPQTDFVAWDTHLFYFEQDFGRKISKRYQLGKNALPVLNQSPGVSMSLWPEEQAFIQKTYAGDFERFGYAIK